MKHLLLSASLFLTQLLSAQVNIDTLAFQDFEVTPAAPVWTFTGPVIYNSGFSSASAAPPNSPLGIGGSRAWETTTNSGGLVLDFANTTIPQIYDSVRVRFNLAALNLIGSSGGPDNLDYVLIAYSIDGGSTFVNRMRIRGAVNDNSFWAYSATGYAKNYYLPATEQVFQPTNSGLQTTLGYSTCEIAFPGTVTQVQLRITGRSSSSTDTWMIDNVLLTGENSCAATLSSISPTVCGSYTSPAGNVHTSSATFNDTIPNVHGCDSVITVNLTVNQPSSANISPVVCGSYTSPAGNVHTVSAMFNDTIPNASGCDSIIAINLTVNQPSSASINPVACGSYTSPAGNMYTASATFNDTIPNASGCDSIITINLTVNTVDTSVSLSGATLTSGATGAQYQWIDCNGGTPINGETAQSFTPTSNGTYAVIVTQNSCTDTSSCVQVLSTGLYTAGKNLSIGLFPNPVQDQVHVTLGQNYSLITIRITQLDGKLLREQQFSSTNAMTLHTEELAAGVYWLTVVADDETSVVKFCVLK